MTVHARKAMLRAGTVLATLALSPALFSGAIRAQEAATQNTAGQTAAAEAEAAATSGTLLDVVVVGAGQEKVAIDTPQAVTVLDAEDLERIQARSVGELFSEVPGATVIGSSSVLGESFNIRGIGETLSSDETRIIMQVDGVNKFFEQYRMGSFFADPELYKRVEVLKGPASSTLYGSGAMGGVISFTTRDASDFLDPGDVFGGRLKTTWDSNANGWLGSAIFAGRPVEDLELLGAFNYRQANDVVDGAGDKIDDSDFSSLNGLAKARYTFGADKDQSVWGSYSQWTSDEDNQNYDQLEWGSSFGDVDRTVTDQTAIIGYDNAFTGNDLLDVKAQVSWSKTLIEQTNQDEICYSPVYCTYPFGLASDYSYETWQAKAQNTARLDLGDSLEAFVTTGVDAQYQERRNPRYFATYTQPGSSSHAEGYTTIAGGFAQAEFLWADRVTVIPGMRIDYTNLDPTSYRSGGVLVDNLDSSSDVGYSPKLAAHVKVTDWLGVFGSVAHTERLPSLDEVYAGYRVNDVKKELSNNVEGGFSLSFDDVITAGDGVRFKATAFRNSITNFYASYWDSTTSSVVTDVLENAIYHGLELEAGYSSATWFASAGASLIRGENEVSGDYLKAIPADNAFVRLGYVFADYDLTVGYKGEFFAGQDLVSGSENATGGYALHNLFAAWKPEDGMMAGSEVRVNVDNVFDREYRNHLDYDNGAGRSFKLSFARSF